MVIFLAGLQSIPARVLRGGADRRRQRLPRQFRDITLPLLTPTIFFLTDRRHHQLVPGLRSGLRHDPDRHRHTTFPTLVYYIYEEGFQNFRMGYAVTIAWVAAGDHARLHAAAVPAATALGALRMSRPQPRPRHQRLLLHVGAAVLRPASSSCPSSGRSGPRSSRCAELFQVTPNYLGRSGALAELRGCLRLRSRSHASTSTPSSSPSPRVIGQVFLASLAAVRLLPAAFPRPGPALRSSSWPG